MAIDTEKLKTILSRHIEKTSSNLYQFATKNSIPYPTLYRFLYEQGSVPSIKTINKILAGLEPWEIATNNVLNLEKR